jgi:DNA-directed RNA polymerase alpha subunit
MMTPKRDWYTVPLAELGLSARAQRLAEASGVTTVGQLCDLSAVELFGTKSFGESLKEVITKFGERGLHLRGWPQMNS